jgi:hypothetical protein
MTECNWRDLCAAAAREADPERMDWLINQIIEQLDLQLGTRQDPLLDECELTNIIGLNNERSARGC